MNAVERFVIWVLVYLGFLSIIKSINRLLDKLDDSMRKGTSSEHAD